MPKYFTRDEAERVLPKVEGLLREALYLKSEYQEADHSLKASTRDIAMRGGMNVDRDRLLQVKQRRDSLASRLQENLNSVHEYGCQVKDLDTGLLDFPALFEGREVCLCWRLGESRIEFWHGTDEGFRGRKPIDDHFLAHHKGDSQS